MVISKDEGIVNIELSGEMIGKVEAFKYLIMQLNTTGNEEQVIMADSVSQIYHALRNSFLRENRVSKR